MIKLWCIQLIEYYVGTKIIFINLCNHLKTHLYVKWEKAKTKNTKLYVQCDYIVFVKKKKIYVEGKNNAGKKYSQIIGCGFHWAMELQLL